MAPAVGRCLFLLSVKFGPRGRRGLQLSGVVRGRLGLQLLGAVCPLRLSISGLGGRLGLQLLGIACSSCLWLTSFS